MHKLIMSLSELEKHLKMEIKHWKVSIALQQTRPWVWNPKKKKKKDCMFKIAGSKVVSPCLGKRL